MRTPLLACLLAFPLSAHAGAAAPLGFTPDGQVVVLLEQGTHDGSGFPFAKVTFLDAKQKP